jgi:uncharacterized protein YndB with AHSA1/START domain
MSETANQEKTELRLTRLINAKREKVFRAWTDPDWVCRWFAPGEMTVPNADVDAKVGGNYRIQMQNNEGKLFITSGTYKEIVANEKLVFSWGWEGDDRYESVVTILLNDSEGGTELTLIHERLRNTESVEKHTQGWTGCLANLAARIIQF